MRRGVALRNLQTGGFGQAGRITRQGLRLRTHDKARPAYGYVPVELVHIMRDHEASRRARLTSCEHLLDYECPSEVIDEAKAVLMSIVEDSETLIDTKLDALIVIYYKHNSAHTEPEAKNSRALVRTRVLGLVPNGLFSWSF